jgi:hypothetical protein
MVVIGGSSISLVPFDVDPDGRDVGVKASLLGTECDIGCGCIWAGGARDEVAALFEEEVAVVVDGEVGVDGISNLLGPKLFNSFALGGGGG